MYALTHSQARFTIHGDFIEDVDTVYKYDNLDALVASRNELIIRLLSQLNKATVTFSENICLIFTEADIYFENSKKLLHSISWS